MRLRSNCCYWLTLLLVGSMIISVSPISSTIATTNFLTTSLKSSIIASSKHRFLSSESDSSILQRIHQDRIDYLSDGKTSLENQTPVNHNRLSHSTGIYESMFFNTNPFEPRYIGSVRKERDIELNDDSGFDKCRSFREGDVGQNTLYSPDYPSNYPKNINCTKIIEAPRGQLIRLDFRNSFNIEEKEDCKFDYLEIRDGPYGFSNLIGRYCGEEFPPMITSKERHLWMHFHSDESIEYSGFTAVYEFIDRPKEAISTELNCTIVKDGFEGFINSTDVPQYVLSNVTRNKIPLDCMWIIKVKEKWKIQVKFLHFNLNKPNDCDINFIDIFAEDTNIPSRVKNFCGSTGESVSSESNLLHIRFYAEPIAMNSSFEILYTAFRDKGTASCVEDEYDCEDATCISSDLKCNGRDNCKFRWDEEGCEDKIGGQSEHVVIIIVVFVLILGGMIVTFLINCVRKLLQDQKTIREHVRQSKESKLDEMGRRSSEKRSRENLSIKLSPREKHSQTSLQILDDVSNRFYREIIPISVQTSKSDIKADSILRQHHDIVVQTSLGSDDVPLSDRGVCDMGCQTRESLFQPVARQKSITSSSPNQSAAAIRFSTFGYDKSSNAKGHHTLSRQSSTNVRLPSESIELDERLHSNQRQQHNSGVGQDISTVRMPQEICHHHHQHQQHLQKQQQQQQQQQQQLQHHPSDIIQQQQQQQQQSNQTPHQQHGHHHHHHHTLQGLSGNNGSNKGKQKIDESKAFIDIRNSAPDVIIMTSH